MCRYEGGVSDCICSFIMSACVKCAFRCVCSVRKSAYSSSYDGTWACCERMYVEVIGVLCMCVVVVNAVVWVDVVWVERVVGGELCGRVVCVVYVEGGGGDTSMGVVRVWMSAYVCGGVGSGVVRS